MADWAGTYLRALLVIGVLWWGLLAGGLLLDGDFRQHVTGRSEALGIEILDYRRGDTCGSKQDEYAVSYRHVDDREVRVTTMCRKGAPDLGRQQAWRTDDGRLHLDSPRSSLVWPLAAPLLFAAVVTVVRSRRGSADRPRGGAA